MKKITISFVAFLLTGFSLIAPISNASAANPNGFNAGRIIDDSVFVNVNSMSVSAIQAFLNSKVSVCDTNGTQQSEYGGGTRAQWAANASLQPFILSMYPTFTCIKDYSEGGQTSAQIIYNVAQQYSINPQVLIVLLQKEQGLITDTWPLNVQYRSATGYGCPDTAPCDSQYYGLTNQLTWSGKMFRSILNNSPTWYTPYILGNNFIQYSPTSSCGGSTVNIQNRSTQALYNYTPYQPNQASLNAGYGDAPGDCDSHGNRNFYLYFTDWFGSTTGPEYAAMFTSQALYSDINQTSRVPKIGSKYITTPGQTVYAKVEALNIGRGVWDGHGNLGTARSQDRVSALRTGDWIAPQRPATLKTNPINPNQTGVFTFPMQIPADQGVYNESFSVVEDGKAWTDAITTFSIDAVNASTPTISNNFLASNGTNVLNAGSSILSPDTYTILNLSAKGELSLHTNYQSVWSVPVFAGAGAKLILQSDGNLVLYNKNLQPVWNTETFGAGTSALRIQEDGNLVLYGNSGAKWSSETNLPLTHFDYTQYDMPAGGALYVGQKIQTPDKRYTIYFQSDGNLVLYNQAMKALWSTGTDGKGAVALYMQGDGNLVLYNANMSPLWYSQTDGRGSSSLLLQMDGNLVLYGPSGATWATYTQGR
jgi:hypothetical protein